jgi:hypothetical protein
MLKDLRQRFVFLKHEKGNGIVLLKQTDYIDSISAMFADTTKYKLVDNLNNSDICLIQLNTLQQYLRTIHNRDEMMTPSIMILDHNPPDQPVLIVYLKSTNISTFYRLSGQLLTEQELLVNWWLNTYLSSFIHSHLMNTKYNIVLTHLTAFIISLLPCPLKATDLSRLTLLLFLLTFLYIKLSRLSLIAFSIN